MISLIRRAVFREVAASALLGVILFTFVLFLQRLGRGELFEILVRSSAPPETVIKLFLMLIPPTLPFTLPVGVLVGVLIGLSRMSSDGEITGMRAAGVSGRRVVLPILAFAFLAMAATACASLWLTPLSIRQTYATLNKLLAEQITAEIQPRVFAEQFPNSIVYVGDVIPGPVVRWRNVFLADLRPAGERGSGPREKGDAPSVTFAREAIAVPDAANSRIQLSMFGVTKHETGKQPTEYFNNEFDRGAQVLYATRPGAKRPSRQVTEMDTGPLWRLARTSREARMELHQRFALPLACMLLALVGIPLGVSSRKSGKSGAFVITVGLAFLYYIGMVTLLNLAKEGRISVEVAAWTPDALFAIAGVVLLLLLETPGDRDLVGRGRVKIEALARRLKRRSGSTLSAPAAFGRFPLIPQIVDTYVLSSFLFYFVVLLASFVMMTHVFTFFELLGDILKRNIPMPRVLTYHLFLTPKLIYDSTPISVLVAVLVTFGIMAKHNEVTAFKATGVSLFRLAVPVLAASMVMSGGLFAFDHYYVPEANRRQDAIRDEIKGRPKQTYLDPGRKWIMGENRIYYYKYFDPAESVMGGVSVYEIDMRRFRLRRHISAERAHWQPSLKTWVFENGWWRDINGIHESDFRQFQAATFNELDEPPGYFLKESKQEKQMNFIELDRYIQDLRQSGFDTVRLQVQLQKKFSVPLFALVMALISIPFAFLTGSRGAMAGVGVSLGIAIGYWAISQVFEQIGNMNQLPAAVAAWSPDAIFSLASLYLMARLKT